MWLIWSCIKRIPILDKIIFLFNYLNCRFRKILISPTTYRYLLKSNKVIRKLSDGYNRYFQKLCEKFHFQQEQEMKSN